MMPVLGHPRTRFAYTGWVVLAIGVVGCCTLLAVRGLSPQSIAALWTGCAVVLAGLATALLPRDSGDRVAHALWIAAWSVAFLAVLNFVVPWIDVRTWSWRPPVYFPLEGSAGSDFRIGAYQPAQAFSDAASGWPPLMLIVGLPFTLLSENAAYALQVVILVVLNLVAAFAVGDLLTGAFTELPGQLLPNPRIAAKAAIVIGILWLLLSYGFLFSLERGNFDAYAACLMVLGLLSLKRRPHDPWLPAIAIALATHIKIYPALLFLLVVQRFRWRSVLPILLSNAVLALSAGPQNLARYFHNLTLSVAAGASWFGNQSAKSFSQWIDTLHPWYAPHVPVWVLIALPLALLAAVLVKLWPRRTQTSALLMLCCMLPVMCLVPSVSHDYKTVILTGPIIALVGLQAAWIGSGSTEAWAAFIVTLVAALFIARAPGLAPNYAQPEVSYIWPTLMVDKYPAILLFEAVVVWTAWRLPTVSAASNLTDPPA